MMKWFLLLFALIVQTLSARSQQTESQETASLTEKENDLVTRLPGQPWVNFRQYAGYVKLPPSDNKALFYWFFEAEYKPSNKPLVLWLNGGPGCSSVSIGAAQEIGPFLVGKHGLYRNHFSWNKDANLLFLESPFGVGFSYTTNPKDYESLGDKVTAEDSHTFLVNWFKRFPEFKSNDFYIATESYGGHYGRQLGELIMEKKHEFNINFKGLLLGNPAINYETDTKGMVDFAWSRAIISDELYNRVMSSCRFQQLIESKNCTLNFAESLLAYSGIDMYGIYSTVCNTIQVGRVPFLLRGSHILPRLKAKLKKVYDPCTEHHVERYFNRPDVQKALHANVTNLPYPYTPCSQHNWADQPLTVLPVIQKLMNAGIRIWVYSGDTDGTVPVTSTRPSLKKLGLKVKSEWRAWYDKHNVVGWTETYEGGMVYATFRGAGHQVPVLAPRQALSFFKHFLAVHPLPSSKH